MHVQLVHGEGIYLVNKNDDPVNSSMVMPAIIMRAHVKNLRSGLFTSTNDTFWRVLIDLIVLYLISMDGEKTGVKKSSLVAAVLFAVAFVIYSVLFISDFETSTTSKNALRGILAVLFAILSIMNYLKHKRARA